MRYRDFEEFLASCNARGVRYLVVGAHALAFHALPRATKDLDLYVDPSVENAERLLSAVHDFFGGADIGFTVADVTELDTILQLGIAPVRIDLLSSIAGIESFEQAWQRREDAAYGTIPTHYLSLEDLIAAKRSAGRDQDRSDLEHLERALRAREGRP
ncbi:MAG TPA: nucleotidyltransferase [Thermoanaerobaculia bacterium]|nr:nucleotidyltransferase [Thermoanaerobaculia bacterium]